MGKRARRPPSFAAAGPADLAEAKQFPTALLTALATSADGEACLARLQQVLYQGLVVGEEYAGMGTMSMALKFVMRSCKQRGVARPDSFGVVTFRASDIDPLCRDLFGLDRQKCPYARSRHVFGDILDRLTPTFRDSLTTLMPGPGDTAADTAVAAEHVASILQANERELFNKHTAAWCYLHKRECPLYASAAALDDIAVKEKRLTSILDEHGELIAERRPWQINTAGHSCKGWSMRGLRGGMAHEPSGLPMLTWTCQGRSMDEDIVFAECTPAFDVQELARGFPHHELITLYVGPQLLGFPHRRHRVLNALVNRRSTIWLGPSQEKAQASFDAIFMRTTVMDAHDLCTASPEESLQYMERLASRHGKTLHGARLDAINVPELLSPSAVQRYNAYREKMLTEVLSLKTAP